MGVVVGGANAWKVKRKGDIAIAFHWMNGEPALVLFPARPNTLGASAFCVALSAAYKYAQPNGYPTPYCVQQAAKAAAIMGMYPDRFTIHRIADVILENIEDLLDMPPEPAAHAKEDQRKRRVIGEMTFKSEGKTVAELPVEDLAPGDMVIEVPDTTLH